MKTHVIVLRPDAPIPDVYRQIGARYPADWAIIDPAELPSDAKMLPAKPGQLWAVYSYTDIEKEIAETDKRIAALQAERATLEASRVKG